MIWDGDFPGDRYRSYNTPRIDYELDVLRTYGYRGVQEMRNAAAKFIGRPPGVLGTWSDVREYARHLEAKRQADHRYQLEQLAAAIARRQEDAHRKKRVKRIKKLRILLRLKRFVTMGIA